MSVGAHAGGMGASTSRSERMGWAALVVPCVALGVAATVLLEGNPVVAFAVPLLALVGWRVLRGSLRGTLLFTVVLVLLCDAPQDRPADGMWQSPLYWLGAVLVNNLGKTFHLPALNFSSLDLLVGIVVGALLLKRLFGTEKTSPRLPRPLAVATWSVLGALGLWVVIGALQGGSVVTAYWQLRQLLYLPVLLLLFAAAGLGSREDLRTLGRAVVAAACVKVAVGAFFFFLIARAQGLSPKYVTSHADTVLFALAIVLVTTRWLLRPDRRSLLVLGLVTAWLLLGIFLNNRRMAYVAVSGAMAVVLLATPSVRAKRTLKRGALVLVPLAAAYVAVGWNAQSALFTPVERVRSMFAPEEDSSTESREIENANLARSLKERPLLGAGFGQEYSEYELGPDIGRQFLLYRSIPHNSVLGLLWAMGPFGLAALCAFLATGSWLAARSFRFAGTLDERIACLSGPAVVLLYVLQAWGDMGTQNWAGTFLVAAALAVAARIGTERGAFAAAGGGA